MIAEYDSDTNLLEAKFSALTPTDYVNIVDFFKVLNDVRTKKRPKSTPVGTSIEKVLYDWRRTTSIKRRGTDNERHTHLGRLNDGISDEEIECHTVTEEDIRLSIKREILFDPTDDVTSDKLKISRKLPEESDKKLLISDRHIKNKSQGGIVREKEKQSKITNSEDLNAATEHTVERKHVQNERMLKHAMVEEWPENNPQDTCIKEDMPTDQFKLIPNS